MKKMLNSLFLLALTYPCGIFVGLFFRLLVILKRIRVLYWERFPHWQRKIILASNHPSLLEPFLLPALFFREYFLHPFKYGPWNTPDRINFYDRWYWFWLRPRSIPIDRKNESGKLRVFLQIKRVLDSGQIVILFPEGGRTFKGEQFLYSKNGKRIRTLQTGIGWLALKTGASVLPVWVEGTEKVLPNSPNNSFPFLRLRERIMIKIGELLRGEDLQGKNKEQVTQIIANALLKLADEGE